MSTEIDEAIMAALCVLPFVAVLALACWGLLSDRKSVRNER